MIEPITNRMSSRTRTTAEDMNRICANYNEAFGLQLRTNWTKLDIVDAETWNTIIETAQKVGAAYGLNIDHTTNFTNMNNVEMLIKRKVENAPRRLAFRLPTRREF